MVFLEGKNRPVPSFVGRRLRDDAFDDYGTIVGMHGKKWHVEWDRATPHPSYVDPRKRRSWWRLVPETGFATRDAYRQWLGA